jgi:hypothetical protein
VLNNRAYNLTLACEIGLNGAIFLGQIDYWLRNMQGTKRHEGKRWVFRSQAKMAEKDFPFWSPKTIQRIVTDLQQQGILEVAKLSSSTYRQVNYYTINYQHPVFKVVANDDPTRVDDEGPLESGEVDEVNLTLSDEVTLSVASGQSDLIDKDNLTSSLKTNELKQTEKKKKNNDSPSVESVVDAFGNSSRQEEVEKLRTRSDHGPTIAAYWRKALSDHGLAHSTQAEMAITDIKIMRTLLASLPDVQVLEDALAEWADFSAFARQHYEMKLPVKPRPKDVAHLREVLAEYQTRVAEHADADEVDWKIGWS